MRIFFLIILLVPVRAAFQHEKASLEHEHIHYSPGNIISVRILAKSDGFVWARKVNISAARNGHFYIRARVSANFESNSKNWRHRWHLMGSDVVVFIFGEPVIQGIYGERNQRKQGWLRVVLHAQIYRAQGAHIWIWPFLPSLLLVWLVTLF